MSVQFNSQHQSALFNVSAVVNCYTGLKTPYFTTLVIKAIARGFPFKTILHLILPLIDITTHLLESYTRNESHGKGLSKWLLRNRKKLLLKVFTWDAFKDAFVQLNYFHRGVTFLCFTNKYLWLFHCLKFLLLIQVNISPRKPFFVFSASVKNYDNKNTEES